MIVNPNFLVFSLCDNDYGNELEFAIRAIHEVLGPGEILVSEERVKSIAIDLMASMNDLRHAARGFSGTGQLLRNYLEKTLLVDFAMASPTDDHDSGSAAVDRCTGYVWRY